MNQSKVQTVKVIIILACIILIVLSILTIIFGIEIISNKKSKTSYKNIGKTEQKMLETVQNYLNEKGKKLDKPIAFVKDNGIFRGRAYVFNVPLTENKLDYGMNGGTYSAEILLPEEYEELPTMYRCSVFAPDLGSLLFPSDYKKVELCDEEVYVITFNEKSLKDGSFTTLLAKALGE